jgi:arsenate reductase (thioredoxin)
MTQRRVLVICTHNSARSQMAEGMLRAWGGEHIAAYSGGTELSTVRPEAITAMDEIGIDISGQRSKLISEFAGQTFDWVITVCDRARQHCATIPGMGQAMHWSVEDPSEATGSEDERMTAFRRVRDDLRGRIRMFILAAGRDDIPAPEPVRLPERIIVG